MAIEKKKVNLRYLTYLYGSYLVIILLQFLVFGLLISTLDDTAYGDEELVKKLNIGALAAIILVIILTFMSGYIRSITDV